MDQLAGLPGAGGNRGGIRDVPVREGRAAHQGVRATNERRPGPAVVVRRFAVSSKSSASSSSKCVWYCDTHWGKRRGRVHTQGCKRIYKELGKRGGKLDLGTELVIGPLGELVRNSKSAQHQKAQALYNKALNYGKLLD